MQKGACRYRRMESVRLGRGRVWPSIIQVNQWGPICWPKGFFSWLWRASRSTANWVRLMAAATLLVASWAVDQVCRLFSFSFPFQWDGAAERKPVASDVPADAINGAGRRKPRTRRHLLVSWQPIKPKMTNLPDFFCASGRSQWDERVGGAGAAGAWVWTRRQGVRWPGKATNAN